MHPAHLRLVVPLCLALALASHASAAVIQVPADQPTIQAGIDVAAAGDSVLVAPGTYFESDIDYGGRDIAVIGVAGDSLTIIDAGLAGNGVYFRSRETAAASLEGFTIQGGDPNGVRIVDAAPTVRRCTITASQDAGVLVQNRTGTFAVDPLVVDCDSKGNLGSGVRIEGEQSGLGDVGARFESCAVDSNAVDGLDVIGGSSITVVSSSFTGNDGVGVRLDGSVAAPGLATFELCTISHNDDAGVVAVATAGGNFSDCTISDHDTGQSGAGIQEALAQTFQTFTRCTIARNHSSSFAGGALLSSQGPRSTEFVDCDFIDNSTSGAGGAVLYLSRATDVSIDGCTFVRNVSGFRGGAIFTNTSSHAFAVTRCIFWENEATTAGGAIFNFQPAEDLTVASCTMVGNRAAGGAGIFSQTAGQPYTVFIDQTIITASPEGEAVVCNDDLDLGQAVADCCDFFDNAGGDWVGCVNGQLGENGNVSLDPQFCDAVGGDFRLDADSPCTPANSGCGLIGTLGVGCGTTAVASQEAPAATGLRLVVRPNPVFGRATFSLDGGAVGAAPMLEIYSPTGRLVERRRIGGASEWSPAPDAARGVYLARLVGERYEATAKFLVLR